MEHLEPDVEAAPSLAGAAAVQSEPPSLAPHAHLHRYYAGDVEKRSFLRGIFDRTASDYDRIERYMALGSGSWYRRRALRRAGLVSGMRVLDVAVGTGMVAREAATLVGDPRRVLGLDPSEGMLAETVRQLSIRVVRGTGEQLPARDGAFDFLSMGYALRHLADLSASFREFHRVLRPGGIVCILEITRPRHRLSLAMLRWYMRRVVPRITRLTTHNADTELLWRYYWDTIEACLPPERVIESLQTAGFSDVRRGVELGIFSEYTGTKPADAT